MKDEQNNKIFCKFQYHLTLQRTDKDCTDLLQHYGSLR